MTDMTCAVQPCGAAMAVALALLASGCGREQAIGAEKPVRKQKDLPFDAPTAGRQVAEAGPLTAPLLAITTVAITVDGREVVRLVDGAIREESDDASIPSLTRALMRSARQRSTGEGPDITLLVAPRTPYRIPFRATLSAARAGHERLQILVRSPDGSLGSVVLQLPKTITSAELGRGEADPPVQLIVSVTGRELMLWSISGLEGTLAKPRLRLPARRGQRVRFDAARLTDDLAALVDARWRTGVSPPKQREIILQADPDIPFQTIVDLIIAVRSRADGRPLFPEVLFGRWSFD